MDKLEKENLTGSLPMLRTKAILFAPLCEGSHCAAAVLDRCYEQTLFDKYRWSQEKEQKEQAERERWGAMCDEEQAEAVDEAYDRHMARLLNEYNGEAWLNEGEDEDEQFDGWSHLYISDLAEQVAKQMRGYSDSHTESPVNISEQDVLDGLQLLERKGYVKIAGWHNPAEGKAMFADYVSFRLLNDIVDAAAVSLFRASP